jgi:hypothetical protein
MKNIRGFAVNVVLAALCAGVMLLGVSEVHAQDLVFIGNFTLNQQTQWGGTVLKPGSYAISIESSSMPMTVSIKDSKGRLVADLTSGIDSGKASADNALFIKEKDGRPHVYSLALASLKRVLIYDPALAREAVLDARAPQTVPVALAKR